MQKIFFILLLCPLMVPAQEPQPAYKNDTLYATCGYKIYKGQTLQFAKGTGKNGKFRFITVKNGVAPGSLTGNYIVVKELSNFKVAEPGDGSIEIAGSISFKDSSKANIEIRMSFDQAIENSPDLPSELVVPAEFRNSSRVNLVNALNKLFTLYATGAISKTEYEAQKKKLLEAHQRQ